MSASEELDALPEPEEAPEADEAAEVAPHPRRMLDRYEIIAEIARGGMGTVLLGRLAGAGGFERLMAIKLMHEHLAQDASFVTMLLDEARTAANIHHPNAIGIVDVAESPLGYYLVMAYVEGFTLAEIMEHPALSARDRIRLGLRLLVDACHGLHAAHTTKNARGEPLDIVHRDVSPQNVLVGLDGVGRIVDFGIALAASRIAASRPGMLKGKPSYMAPEQAKGEPCDPRADVFALGTVLWEILVGRRLFQAEMDLATLVQVIDSPIPVPGTIQELSTDALDRVVMKALERDLDARYRDARTLAKELEKAASEAGLIATTHEVADAVEELFAEAIAAKQEAIRHHLSTSTGPKKPLEPGQLGLVPKLYDLAPTARSSQVLAGSGVREREIDAHAQTRASRPGAAAKGDGQKVRTVSLEKDARAVEPSAPVEAERTTGAGGGSRWLWIVAGAVGALVVLAALAWGGGETGVETETVAEPETETETEPETEPETETETETETVAEPETETAAETEREAAAEPETGTDRETAATGSPSRSREGVGGRAAEGRRNHAAGSPRSSSPPGRRSPGRDGRRPDDEPAPPGQRPALETNPYLTR